MSQTEFPKLRDSPLFVPLLVALGLIFVALATSSTSTRWLGQSGYLVGALILGGVAFQTWLTFDKPSNWGAAAGLLGLASSAVFAAAELGALADGEDGGGASVIVPVAWLFAGSGWYAHYMRVKTLRWVITLVQVSFTALSSLVFFILIAQTDTGTFSTIGYAIAGAIGAMSVAVAVTGIIGRIKVELAKRNPA